MKIKSTLTDIKKWIILILIAILSYWAINNISVISGVVSKIFSVLYPFILGGIIAFILNIPMTKIENSLNKRMNNKKTFVRILSIILSLLLFFIIIILIAFLLMPELIENIQLLISNIPGLFDKVEELVLELLDKYPNIQVQIETFFNETYNLGNIVSNLLNYFVNGALGFIGSLLSGFVTLFTAIIFSIYMLSQKEYLTRGSKKLVYATFNRRHADKICEIGKLSNKTFSKFISGQCLEAVILGILMFIAFNIFKFPYALILAVLTSVTALVPIFGAIIAMIIGVVLIGITNPLQALLFIVVFQVVQQIEGNLIYPKVVGKSVGLSPMWTLFSISVGGSLFGIPGMLIGLPLASIVYSIIKAGVNSKLKEKEIEIV